MSSTRKRAGAGLALAVLATGLYATPASANPAGTGLVISEVYGGGGNSGATYTNDFIELYNPTGSAISVAAMSVQYRSTSGTSVGSNITTLAGTVPAGGRYLVQEASNAAVGATLPTPDATGSIAMAGGSGQVLLVNGSAASTVGTGDLAGNANLVDMVGYGTAGSFEGAPTGVALTSTTSAFRNATPLDSDNNAADFAEATPTPEGQGGVTPPPDEFTGTIAEIQGTDTATSPHVDDLATTTGVVTATYPTGGFNGFYLQTEGTGGASDATPGASDAIFVFGSEATAANVTVGELVTVTGPVSEFFGTTEITPAAGGVVDSAAGFAPVTALDTAYPTTETAREAHEGELLAPTNTFTVTNTFTTNSFAEIGLATGTTPLIAPTEVADAQDLPAVAAVAADNAARAVTLDDGASLSYLAAANQGTALPWLSASNPIRVGARATLHAPVIMDFRNGVWKFQPTTPVTGEGASTATFTNTRTNAPEAVAGDIRLATFNVLNYFPTTAEEYVASALGTCTTFKDREGNPITANTCSNNGPRGAANVVNFERQQAKIVNAINKLGASIVSLEEIENSVQFGKNRDFAIGTLVDALNTAAGSTVWAFAPTPGVLPAPAQEDVIRTGFIFKPAAVELVGESEILVDEVNFDNAREPLAQAFKPTGTADTNAFSVVVNHFKSKGSGPDDGTGQGNSNPDRIGQANAVSAFADAFATERGTDAVFLAGDFNAYSMEDPMQVLYGDGYTAIESDTAGEETYSFSGLAGSLDHVLANAAGSAMVAGADVWNINSPESIAFQYSRFNYNVTQFFDASNPFAASDHDPEIVGLDVARTPPADVTLNLLGVNDFHGRINANTVKWAGTVEQLRAAGGEANTLMIGAGDLIGASEFASAVDDDQPTIDMFNALDLDASAVGNHEFDKGYADLRDRVIGPVGARNATWDYLGANVYLKGTTTPALPEYATYQQDGLTIGVIGAVTEETKTLVSPGGITEIDFGNPIDAVNRVAGELSDGDSANGEADVVIASFHSGAQLGTGSTFAQEVAKGGEFAQMVDLDPSVDVIFNGHTHQTYAWDAPIPGEPSRTRPIIQTGEYGTNVGQVELTVNSTTGDVVSYTERNVARTTVADADLVAAYPRVADVKTIVDAALANAATVGNEPVGSITGDVSRAFSNGSYVNGKWVSPLPRTEDRGSESTLGDVVANALRDGLPAENGAADLGIVNPGGLRAELTYAGNTGSNPANTDGVVTYAEANGVLPFVNNIWTVDLTGAQLKAVLEQQWQPAGSSRPFLALGLSDNVRVTQDATKPVGSRITSVIVNDEPLDLATTYTVSTFSFLGTGGDNFTAFTQGSHQDTGLVDRDLWIQYLRDNAGISPDFARQQVAESGLPAEVLAGDAVSFELSKLNLTSLDSPENTTVAVYLRTAGASRKVGDFAVSGGTAAIAFTAPADLVGRAKVVAVAGPSGTQVGLPLTASPSSVTATADPMTYGTAGSVSVTVTSDAPATGSVEVRDDATLLGTGTVTAGSATVTIPGTALAVGSHTLDVDYLGDAQNNPSSTTVRVVVAKASSSVEAIVSPASVAVKGGNATVAVTVSADGVTPTGFVGLFVDGSMVQAKELSNGAADFTVGPFPTLGDKFFQLRYFGDDFVGTSVVSRSVSVVKATPRMTETVAPEVIHARRTKPVVTVRLAAPGFTPVSGMVRLTSGGQSWTRSLSDGRAEFRLPAYWSVGTKTITVRYLGDQLTNDVTDNVTIVVVR